MTQMVTRCPKCATAFRITSTQLESAKGAVRCGSCLHIFKAQDHLVKATPKPTETKPVATKSVATKTAASLASSAATTEKVNAEPTKPAPSPAPTNPATATNSVQAATSKPIIDKSKILADEDDELISDDMDKSEDQKSGYEFDGFLDIDLQPKQTVSLFEREIRYEEPTEEVEQTDESWADHLLDDDEENLRQLSKAVVKTDDNKYSPEQVDYAEEADTPVDESKAAAPVPFDESKYAGPVFSIISETPSPSATEDENDEPAFSEEFLTAIQSPTAAKNKEQAAQTFAADIFAEETPEPEPEKPIVKKPIKSAHARGFEGSRAALLLNIMPAPVEFTARRVRNWYYSSFWSTLAFIMAIVLVAQVAYFKFDYFSRVEPYRTGYALACPVIGCKVPTLVDTSQITTNQVIVRKHPTVAQALIVDAILINKAPFEQPFPDLVLSFSKIDDTPIATRKFSPHQYLGGELAGAEYIPIKQPVHIILELADPGADAVNYHLSIP